MLWIVWGIVSGFGMLVAWKWARGAESLKEIDREFALRDERRKEIAAKRQRPVWQKKLEALWRRGEQVRKKQAA